MLLFTGGYTSEPVSYRIVEQNESYFLIELILIVLIDVSGGGGPGGASRWILCQFIEKIIRGNGIVCFYVIYWCCMMPSSLGRMR